MPKQGFYFSNEDHRDVYLKAKTYAVELSPIVVQGLRDFIKAKEDEGKGFEEITKFVGTRSINEFALTKGEYIKFTGKRVAGFTEEMDGERHTKTYLIVFTRKSKYLLWSEEDDYGDATSEYHIYETFQELLNAGLPGKLIENAIKNMPEIPCRELDV
jgi:hypothetical protein